MPKISFIASMANIATVVATIVSATVALCALFFIFVGIPGLLFNEVPIGEELKPGILNFTPAPHELVPFLSASAILAGLFRKKMLFSWIGLLALVIYALIFLFSLGLGLLPVSGLLLILLIIIQTNARKVKE